MSSSNMNKELKRVGLVGLALIGVLAVHVNWIQAGQADDLRVHALNNRPLQGVSLRARGDIISADGVKMAWSDALSPGNSKTKYQRRYLKNGEAFLPVTGFYAGTMQKAGLELAFNSLLDGTDPRQTTDSWVRLLTGEKPLGGNLYTTIDSKAQVKAYQALSAQSPLRAAAVVIDAETGAIKVAASYPAFNPTSVADIKNPGDDQKKLDELKDAKGQPMVDKAYSELFPPGSSFKTVVAAAFMSKDGNSKDSIVPAPVNVPTGGGQIGNSHNDNICGVPNGSPLIGTFAQSCNTTYALLGIDDSILGNEGVRAQSEKFGFYKKIPIEQDLNAPASVYPHDASHRDEILRGSFGQGETKTTTLQMAMVAASIANGGEMMKPYLVEKAVGRVEGDDGKPKETGTIHKADQDVFAKPLSSDVASQLQDMMREVVSTGTAKNLQGRNIAGKTGTTELTATRGGAWFVGFAPMDKPKYGFAVFVEGSTSLFGASTSGPIAADIIDALGKE
ncbi:penicillin-binding transpeptidase domain-containing protein [Actinocorallia sp. A-T 12471]|uniref:penicillin-binding transpeptidase domain-containing protein n=1 Tax=Actinocorallia sp. A-T 12471 TaxID=3089813 RepID=UPI0029D3AA30|nr:penicillin-binding transpeptidase domain-containing protein [Actinocorallia sp. A-T 12471]MDX6742093.1 penicillin-binding transpeptidase domain-containing protein [Actinocorallia sp. A-T 12471]